MWEYLAPPLAFYESQQMLPIHAGLCQKNVFNQSHDVKNQIMITTKNSSWLKNAPPQIKLMIRQSVRIKEMSD